MSRCNGKNCKFTAGFDIPHSEECELANAPVRQQDNSAGPNNINVLNPEQEDAGALGSAEYMKLLTLAMSVLDVEEVVITPECIEDCDGRDRVMCIANMDDGIHLKLVTMEEAEIIAKEQRGSIN